MADSLKALLSGGTTSVMEAPPKLRLASLETPTEAILLYGEPGTGKSRFLGPLIAEFDAHILVLHCGIGKHGLSTVRSYLQSVGKGDRYATNLRVIELKKWDEIKLVADSGWEALAAYLDDEFAAKCNVLVVEEFNGAQEKWSSWKLNGKDIPDGDGRWPFYGAMKAASERLAAALLALRSPHRDLSVIITTHEKAKDVEVSAKKEKDVLAPAIVGSAATSVAAAVSYVIRTYREERVLATGGKRVSYWFDFQNERLSKMRGEGWPSKALADPAKLWRVIHEGASPTILTDGDAS